MIGGMRLRDRDCTYIVNYQTTSVKRLCECEPRALWALCAQHARDARFDPASERTLSGMRLVCDCARSNRALSGRSARSMHVMQSSVLHLSAHCRACVCDCARSNRALSGRFARSMHVMHSSVLHLSAHCRACVCDCSERTLPSVALPCGRHHTEFGNSLLHTDNLGINQQHTGKQPQQARTHGSKRA